MSSEAAQHAGVGGTGASPVALHNPQTQAKSLEQLDLLFKFIPRPRFGGTLVLLITWSQVNIPWVPPVGRGLRRAPDKASGHLETLSLDKVPQGGSSSVSLQVLRSSP